MKEEIKENIEYLNYCNEQLEKTNKNLNYKVEKLKEDYIITCEQKNQYISTLEQGLNNAEQEIERLNNIINKALRKLRTSKDHFKTESENNAVTFTIKILEERDKGESND